MKCKRLRCDICGRFISYQDIESERATYSLVNPDNHFAPETYETFCSNCKRIARTFDDELTSQRNDDTIKQR